MKKNTLYNKSIVSIQDFTKEEIELVLQAAEFFKKNKGTHPFLKGKILASLFFEPSTRTRLSFESAMYRLSGSVIGFSDTSSTSFSKGESLSDCIKVVSSYADAIVMRHPQEGSAKLAAETSSIPVINGGDGANEHPTQTLLDLFSIKECQGFLEDLHVAFVGDLKHGRTVHSLAVAAAHYNIRMYFVSPESLTLPEHIAHHLRKKGIKYTFHRTIEEVLPKVDVLYVTRIQKERFPSEHAYSQVKDAFLLKKSLLTNTKPNLKILHPLPRVNEIATDIDSTPYAYYFEQSANGVFVREALLTLLLEKNFPFKKNLVEELCLQSSEAL